MKKSGIADKILLCLLAGAMLLGGGGLLFFPAARFSAAENRLLAEKPVFSAESLASGDYTAGWDTYTAERLPGRRQLRQLRAVCELLLGKREVNGVILGRDGSLTRRLTVNESAFRKNLTVLGLFQEKAAEAGLSCTLAVAPRRIDICGDLPTSYDAAREARAYATLRENCKGALILSGFEGEEWFRTDHHWTAAGAYRAYTALGGLLGFIPLKKDAFTPQTVCDSFLGTSEGAAGIPGVASECITLLRCDGDESFRITKDGNPAPFTGFYDFEKLTTKDGYGIFLGGNDGILTVGRGEEDERPVLLLIKDSFANAMIPFLAQHYRIKAIDPRYCKTGVNDQLADADEVLVLCGMQTLTESAVFSSLLR